MSVNVRELTYKCEMETCIYSKSEYYNCRTTIVANSLRSQQRGADIPYPRFLTPQYPISQIFYPQISHIPDFTVNFPYPSHFPYSPYSKSVNRGQRNALNIYIVIDASRTPEHFNMKFTPKFCGRKHLITELVSFGTMFCPNSFYYLQL